MSVIGADDASQHLAGRWGQVRVACNCETQQWRAFIEISQIRSGSAAARGASPEFLKRCVTDLKLHLGNDGRFVVFVACRAMWRFLHQFARSTTARLFKPGRGRGERSNRRDRSAMFSKTGLDIPVTIDLRSRNVAVHFLCPVEFKDYNRRCRRALPKKWV